MSKLTLLILIATVLSALLGGMALQKLLIELPARKRIGVAAFAAYARAADLGNGLYVYPFLAIASEIATIGALIADLRTDAGSAITMLLSFASAAGLAVLVMTFFAAPQMLGVGQAGDDESTLQRLFDSFVLYSWPRAVFICLQFDTLLR